MYHQMKENSYVYQNITLKLLTAYSFSQKSMFGGGKGQILPIKEFGGEN